MKQRKEFHHLSNGYWLKIIYTYDAPPFSSWVISIVVAKTKRKCNDHYNKTRSSPKNLENKSSNHNQNSIESLMVCIKSLVNFEKSLPKNSVIRIDSINDQRIKVYGRLKRYGYKEANWFAPGDLYHKKKYYFKIV